LATIN